jgi:plasmid stabilization system protein ParE
LSVTRVRYTRQAEDDLDSIGEYTLSTFGSRQYDVYMDGLEAHCRRLAETPVLGRPYRLPPYQWSRYVSHVVYFRRKDGGDIVVVRILGKKMNAKLHFEPLRDDDELDDDE